MGALAYSFNPPFRGKVGQFTFSQITLGSWLKSEGPLERHQTKKLSMLGVGRTCF